MSRPYRIIIWGPGDMGGRALRTALQSPQFEVVGVKVFSSHKNGVDIGTLAFTEIAADLHLHAAATAAKPAR